jgi:hypothetical protein
MVLGIRTKRGEKSGAPKKVREGVFCILGG